MFERMRGFINKNAVKNVWYFGFILALGVVLMFLGGRAGGTGETAKADKSAGAKTTEASPAPQAEGIDLPDYERTLEQKLEQTLCAVQGVGKVRVMITVSTRDAVELAKDIVTEKKGSSPGAEQQTEKSETRHITISNGGGQTAAVVTKRFEPKIEGVVIVAQGGDSAEVKTALTRAAEALLGLPAHKIEILKMDAAN